MSGRGGTGASLHVPYPRRTEGGRSLENARVDNGGWAILVLDGARVGADSLNSLDNLVRLHVTRNDFAKDDVLVVQPRGDDGGDEELGAVAVEWKNGSVNCIWPR
jgi:hypothetical protein